MFARSRYARLRTGPIGPSRTGKQSAANVAAVSALYEKTFRIRFVLLDIVPWAAALRGDRVRQISKLMADVPPGRADLVVAFSGRCEGNKAGWTVAVRPIRRRHLGMRDTPCEPGHGAGDPVARAGASLRRFPSRQQRGVGDAKRAGGQFDDQTIRILRLTRDFDFSRGVTSLTPETRRAWSAIYAEGHANGEPNPLAAAFAHAGWTLLREAKPQEAEAALDEAIRLDANVAFRTRLGRVYASTGRLEDAVRELRTPRRSTLDSWRRG
jgi:hypothetical protein